MQFQVCPTRFFLGLLVLLASGVPNAALLAIDPQEPEGSEGRVKELRVQVTSKETGATLPHAVVRISAVDGPRVMRGVATARYEQTDEDGRVRFLLDDPRSFLHRQEKVAVAVLTWGQDQVASPRIVALEEGKVIEVAFSAARMSTIRLRLLSEDGDPNERAGRLSWTLPEAEIGDDNGGQAVEGDSSGITGIAPGARVLLSWRQTGRPSREVEVVAPRTAEVLDLELRAQPRPAHLKAQLSAPGAAGGFFVYVLEDADGFREVGGVATRAEGKFRLAIPPMKALKLVLLEAAFDQSLSLEAYTQDAPVLAKIDVPPTPARALTERLTLRAERRRSVGGIVRDADGKPLSDVTLLLHRAGASTKTREIQYLRTDPQGRFASYLDLGDGEFVLRCVKPPGLTLVSETFNPGRLDLELVAEASVRLSGRVAIARDLGPLELRLVVELLPRDPGNLAAIAKLTPDATFSFEQVQRGVYDLVLSGDGSILDAKMGIEVGREPMQFELDGAAFDGFVPARIEIVDAEDQPLTQVEVTWVGEVGTFVPRTGFDTTRRRDIGDDHGVVERMVREASIKKLEIRRPGYRTREIAEPEFPLRVVLERDER